MPTPENQRDPAAVATVSAMLSDIEAGGLDAVLGYATTLDRYDGRPIQVGAEEMAAAGDTLPADLREAIELGSTRTKAVARVQREVLHDVEVDLVPGVVTGSRYVLIGRVGA